MIFYLPPPPLRSRTRRGLLIGVERVFDNTLQKNFTKKFGNYILYNYICAMKDETSLAEALSNDKELISYLVEASSGFTNLLKTGYKLPMQAFTENMTVEEIKNTKFIPFIED